MVSPGPMHITLPPDLADAVRQRVAAGEFNDAESVVRAALALLGSAWSGDGASARTKIEQGWRDAEVGRVLGGADVMRRARER